MSSLSLQPENPVDKALAGINPRSGKANYLLIIAKIMPAAQWVPKHVNEALTILHKLAPSKAAQTQMINLFTSPGIKSELLHGFVECVESDEQEMVSAIFFFGFLLVS